MTQINGANETSETNTTTLTAIDSEPGYKKKWRPAMAYAYMAICIFDFIIAPILTGAYFQIIQPELFIPNGMTPEQAIEFMKTLPQHVYTPWTPLTLAAGGFFHISMGTILGITSFTRGQEKVAKINR